MSHIIKLFRVNTSRISKRTFLTSSKLTQTVKEENKKQERVTHFGFETVTESEKTQKVSEVFNSVAKTYDDMNDLMSLGVQRLWKDTFIQHLGPTLGSNLLDVAGGTGDIAIRYVNYILNLPGRTQEEILNSGSHVTVIDINPSMLEVGKQRVQTLGLPPQFFTFQEENAENLTFKDNEFTACSVSFGIRNVTNIEKVLAEMYRVIKPGGRFMCLEFSKLNNNLAQWLYDQYSFNVIPIMGQLVTGNKQPYQYLVESINKFPNQEIFKQIIQEAGFKNVTYENLSMGMVAIHSGYKP